MALETLPFDTSEYAASPEAQVDLLNDAMESGDPAYIAHVLGVIARARGMTEIARDAGMTRQALYKALASGGDPKLSTLTGVLKALGITLHVAPTRVA